MPEILLASLWKLVHFLLGIFENIRAEAEGKFILENFFVCKEGITREENVLMGNRSIVL